MLVMDTPLNIQMVLLNCQSLYYTRNSPPAGVGNTEPTRETGAKGAEEINGGFKRVSRSQRLKQKLELLRNQGQPNPTTKPASYGPMLQACSRERCLDGGLQAHAHIIKRGCESDRSLQSSLLRLYLRCGRPDFARRVFDTGAVRTSLVSWNSMIAAYSRSGCEEEALSMFLELQLYGFEPDQFTLPVVIAVARQRGERFLGRQIHSLSIKLGYGGEEFVSNSLIQMYASFGRVDDSLRVFNGISDTRNPVAWNSMIAQLVDHGLHEDALVLHGRMRAIGTEATPLTSSSLLKACAALEAIAEGKQVHALIVVSGFLPNIILETALLELYAKCGELQNGRRIFEGMEERNVIAWNSMIRGYSQMGYREEALKLFQVMRREEVTPDKFTFPALLAGFTIGDYAPQELKSIHSYVIKAGLETDRFIGTSLITIYSTKQSIGDARLVFDCIDCKDIGVWSSMISANVNNGDGEEAVRLFLEMLDLEITPNPFVYSSLFTACGELSRMEMGKQIHAYGLKSSSESFDVAAKNSLVSMYSNCGCIVEAWRVFDSIHNPSVITFNSVISALAHHGLPDRAAELFRRMKLVGQKPDEITLLNLLSAFNHAGLIDEGLELFGSMEENHGIEPRYQHYACVVDMLARAGEMEEAIRFIDEMPFEVDTSLWRIILGACAKHRNVRIGRQIAELLIKLEPQEATNYVLLANIYARAGRWVEGERVRHRMDERGVKKEAGVSWIEIGRRTHSFGVEDRSHPQSEDIHGKLRELIAEIKAAGYVPDISFTLHDMEEERREESLFYHSEKLALAFGVLSTDRGVTLRIMKNLRVCGDCHAAFKYFSLITGREIVLRDSYRFHHFTRGVCSCGDYW